jgi:competence protein ComEA
MLKKILAVLAMLYAVAAFAAVDVNKATAAELDGIKGIGPGISTKILDERKKGSFKDWQDFIDRVKGVGEGNAAKFSAEGLTVNGAGFKGAVAAKKEDKAAPMKAAASAPAAKEEKKDAKAEAKAKKEADKKAKAEEAKAKKEAAKKAKEDAKKAKSEPAKPAASAASAAKPAASAKK